MATGKSASMREGPPADLSRKTAEDSPPTHPTPNHPARTQPTPGQAGPVPPAADQPPERRTKPHPSLGTSALGAEPADVHIPTPQERLRNAFSADIPENALRSRSCGVGM